METLHGNNDESEGTPSRNVLKIFLAVLLAVAFAFLLSYAVQWIRGGGAGSLSFFDVFTPQQEREQPEKMQILSNLNSGNDSNTPKSRKTTILNSLGNTQTEEPNVSEEITEEEKMNILRSL